MAVSVWPESQSLTRSSVTRVKFSVVQIQECLSYSFILYRVFSAVFSRYLALPRAHFFFVCKTPFPLSNRFPSSYLHAYVGGLFPVHEKSQDQSIPCSHKVYNRGIQRLEAMLYAVDTINKDDQILK